MSKLNISIEDLEQAIQEIKARSDDMNVTIDIVDGRKLSITASDNGKNMLTALLYSDSTMEAEFRMTQRLRFMKDKKRL